MLHYRQPARGAAACKAGLEYCPDADRAKTERNANESQLQQDAGKGNTETG